MKSIALGVITVAGGAALAIPSAGVLVAWLGAPGLLPSTDLERIVFLLVLARVVLYAGIPELRKMSLGATIIFLSGDVLILPFVGLAVLLTGDASYGDFGRTFLGSWLSTGSLLYPPLAIFLVVRSMAQRSRLIFVVPAAVGSYEVTGVVLKSLGAGGGTGGLVEVAKQAIAGAGAPIPSGEFVGELLFACGALLFAALAAYSVTISFRHGDMVLGQLSLVVVGAVALLVWLVTSPKLGAMEILALPAAVIVGTIWVATREN